MKGNKIFCALLQDNGFRLARIDDEKSKTSPCEYVNIFFVFTLTSRNIDTSKNVEKISDFPDEKTIFLNKLKSPLTCHHDKSLRYF